MHCGVQENEEEL